MKCLFMLVALAAPITARAADFQDLGAIERAVVIAAGADIGQPGGPVTPIDRRLKLAACSRFAVDPPMLSAITVRCPTIGWRLRVPLMRAGGVQTVSYRQAEKAAAVIRRGDPVDLEAGEGSFTVSTEVIAQEDGAPGARIRVKSEGKSTAILAEVIESGRVRILGFN